MTPLSPNKALPNAYRRWPIYATLILILWVAFFLRVHRLDSLPPGLFVDEAINGLDALTIGGNGRFPLFFPANNGREPLFLYLQAAAIRLLGLTPWSMRLVAAYAGLLAVPLVFATGRALWNEPRHAAWVGLAAAALLATLFWHVQLSRLVFRAILLPLFSLAAVYFFWRGWQHGRRRHFLLAGLALGLSQYTYLAARLLPMLFIGFAATQYLADLMPRGRDTAAKPRPWRGLLWLLAVALVVALPLAVTLAQNPAYADGRTGDVAVWTAGSGLGEIANNGWRVARMFLDAGDSNVRHNLSGRPALDIVQAIGFWTGLALALWRWRRPQQQLLLWWLAILLLPTLLSTDAPHFLRASGAVGAVALLSGGGWVWWGQTAVARLNRPALVRYGALLPLGLLLSGGLSTGSDYFNRWPATPHLYDAFETLETEAAAVALAALEDGPVFLIPDLAGQNSRALDLLVGATAVRPIPTGCLVYPAQIDQPTTFLVRTQRDKETLPRLQALFPQAATETAVAHPTSGEIFFESLTVAPGNQAIGVSETAVAQFAETLQLRSFDVAHEDDAIHASFVWYALQPPAADHTLFLHLYPNGHEEASPLAQLDIMPCLSTSQWLPGEIVSETYTLPLPPDLPPGSYTLALGWYTWPTFTRLPLSGATSVLPGDRLHLHTLTLP